MNLARLRLTFPGQLIRQPVIARLVREFDLLPNIREAHIGDHDGWVILELGGDDGAIERAIDWMRGLGVDVERLGEPPGP